MVESEGLQATESVTPEATESEVPVTPETSSAPTEHMVPQATVDKIIGKVRSEAEEKAYARARKELEGKRSLGGMELPSQDEMNRMIDERVEQRAQEAYAKQVISDFTQKIKAGAEKYQDFDSVVSDLNLASNPHLVRWANGLDNTADVLYDLGKNPEKFASVMMLAQSSPNLALRKLHDLSVSIKRNEDAKSQPVADEPLDHLQPPNNGLDSGKMSVSDLQKLDWLRG